jgi:hypothetical protein
VKAITVEILVDNEFYLHGMFFELHKQLKQKDKGSFIHEKISVNFKVENLNLAKAEREIRHEEINGVNYLIVKSNV